MRTFVYSGIRFDPGTGLAEFDFAHEGGSRRLCFTEGVEFPLPEGGVGDTELTTFRRVLNCYI